MTRGIHQPVGSRLTNVYSHYTWRMHVRAKPRRHVFTNVAMVVIIMTNEKLALVYRALLLLRVALEEPVHDKSTQNLNTVDDLAINHLIFDSDSDYSCEELWSLYREVAGVRLVPYLTKTVFLKKLPSAMERAFGVRKSTNLVRDGHRVRGFKRIGPRPIEEPITAAELELPIEPELVLPEPDLDPKPPSGPMPMTFVRTDAPRIN